MIRAWVLFGALTVPLAAAPLQPWPDATVRYHFDASVDSSLRAQVTAALQLWTAGPVPLRFVEDDSLGTSVAWALGWGASVRVRVDPSLLTLGRSTLGKGLWAELVFNPSQTDPSWLVADLAHEWGHVLGLTHEHQRHDRDLFVAFPPDFLSGLSPGRRADYVLDPNDPPAGVVRPYDYASLMHYSSNVDGNRLVRRDTGELIAGAREPSLGDWTRLAVLYSHSPRETP